MIQRFCKACLAMDFEDRILHLASIMTMISLFPSWISSSTVYDNDPLWSNAFHFRFGYIGFLLFFFQVTILIFGISSLLSFSILKKSQRLLLYATLTTFSNVLVLSCFSIVFRATFELANATIRLSMYVAIIASFVTMLYALLRFLEYYRSRSYDAFQHPDDVIIPRMSTPEPIDSPPPPPLPTPPPLEDH